MNSPIKLNDFLNHLQESKINFRLSKIRQESVMVEIAVPGERWEVEFMDDGTIEVEVFRSTGIISDEKQLDVLFRNFSDK